MPQQFSHTLSNGFLLEFLEDPALAAELIDKSWWEYGVYDGAIDRDWCWRDLVHETTQGFLSACLCVKFGTKIVGAIHLSLNGTSYLIGDQICRIDNLAVAPPYRYIVQDRDIRDIGTTLVKVAAKWSFVHGFGGRLRLNSLNESKSFYLGLGFQQVSTQGHLPVLELPLEEAQELLRDFELQLTFV